MVTKAPQWHVSRTQFMPLWPWIWMVQCMSSSAMIKEQTTDGLSSSHAEDADTDTEGFDVGNSWLEDGSDVLRCTEQPYLLRQANQDAKLMLSIGGRVWSTGFAIIASKANTRTTFARSAVSLLKNWDFNGIDIDWKLPNNEDDAANMVLLLEAIRGELDSVSSDDHLDLSIVAPVGLEHFHFAKLPDVSRTLDRVDLMACDYAEPWSFEAGYGSNLGLYVEEFNSTQLDIEDTVHAYLEAGVPAEKLALGLPAHWHSWQRTGELNISFLEPTLVKWENAVQGRSARASTLAFEYASNAHHHVFGAIPNGSGAEARWQQPIFPAISELS
ncbi:hypothetical protein CEP54_014102 [Fusarium duplospermum]|uniref:chitinase n=1 Tax=Fusarium duplospermum TaxID=1325734 RepID=A0A428NYQ2_9HYPO|nr:hypothetical protein CEP54_014102 [Fusarium duplospermum]